MIMYLSISKLPYDGLWVNGIFDTLEEALTYLKNNITDEEEYFVNYIELWEKTKMIKKYKYNIKTKDVEEIT